MKILWSIVKTKRGFNLLLTKDHELSFQREARFYLVVDDEAVSFVGPGDEVVRVRIVDHLPQLAQKSRYVWGHLRQDYLHHWKHCLRFFFKWIVCVRDWNWLSFVVLVNLKLNRLASYWLVIISIYVTEHMTQIFYFNIEKVITKRWQQF